MNFRGREAGTSLSLSHKENLSQRGMTVMKSDQMGFERLGCRHLELGSDCKPQNADDLLNGANFETVYEHVQFDVMQGLLKRPTPLSGKIPRTAFLVGPATSLGHLLLAPRAGFIWKGNVFGEMQNPGLYVVWSGRSRVFMVANKC